MKIWEKIIFWAGTSIVVWDSLIWQWMVKIDTEPTYGWFSLGYKNIIGDILIVVVWLIVLVRIYQKANRVDAQ